MTRLTEANVNTVIERLPGLESSYREMTGKSLFEIGCQAAGISYWPEAQRKRLKVAVVPITAGQGVIGNFCEAVALILREFAGVDAYVTEKTDVAGIYEATLREADMLFMADDDVFICRHLKTGATSDNGLATGRGFAALLCSGSEMTLANDRDILVLGAGHVGTGASQFLHEQDKHIKWFDLKKDHPLGFNPALRDDHWQDKEWTAIIDATYAASFIDPRHLVEGGVISAPGIPLGITEQTKDKAKFVFHDALETGVITMLCEGMKHEHI